MKNDYVNNDIAEIKKITGKMLIFGFEFTQINFECDIWHPKFKFISADFFHLHTHSSNTP